MNLNENPAESKASFASVAIPRDLCALDFMIQDSVGSNLNVKCEFGMGAVAVIQYYGRLDRHTYPRLSLALANAIKQEYRTLVASVLTDLFDMACSMGLTVVTVAMISKLAEHWNCSLPYAFNKIVGTALANRTDNAANRQPENETSNPGPGANHAVP